MESTLRLHDSGGDHRAGCQGRVREGSQRGGEDHANWAADRNRNYFADGQSQTNSRSTMLIHGQYDDVADPEGLMPFFLQLPNPHKKYVIIPDAGHMMQFQNGHRLFQEEVALFFKTAR